MSPSEDSLTIRIFTQFLSVVSIYSAPAPLGNLSATIRYISDPSYSIGTSSRVENRPFGRSYLTTVARNAGHFIRLMAAQMSIKKTDGALPRQLCRRLIVARGGIVVETVLHTRVDECLIINAGSFQRGLIFRPSTGDALVLLGVVQQQRRLDPDRISFWRLLPIKRHRRIQIWQTRCQKIGDAATVAKTHYTDFAIALGKFFQHIKRSNKVFLRLGLIKFGKELARCVLVPRITAQWKQCIRCKGNKIIQRQTARNILDMRIKPAILM